MHRLLNTDVLPGLTGTAMLDYEVVNHLLHDIPYWPAIMQKAFGTWASELIPFQLESHAAGLLNAVLKRGAGVLTHLTTDPSPRLCSPSLILSHVSAARPDARL